MQVTYQQAMTAHAALQAMSKTAQPFALRLRVAKLLRLLGAITQDFQTARQQAYMEVAEKDDAGTPIGVRDPGGAAVYKVAPTDELKIALAIQSKLGESVDVAADPFTLHDFPAKLGKDDNGVTADILAGLGPFLDLEGV